MEQRLKDVNGELVVAYVGGDGYLALGKVVLPYGETHKLAHMLADLVLVSREGKCGICGR